MSEASCLPQSFDSDPAASPYFHWEAPGKPASVQISHSVVDKLDRAAVEAFRSISSRGSEIGGLLLGSVSAGTPAVVSIDDYEPIPCDYSRGPLFHLSNADVERLETALARRQREGVRVLGFFRSHTRKGLALDAEDLTLMESHFRDPRTVILLVRPFATKPSVGGIFMREEGRPPGEASCLEFPFQSALLPATRGVPQNPSPTPRAVAPDPPPPVKPARGQVVPMTSRLRVALPVPPAPEPPVPEAPPPEKPAPPPAAIVEEAQPAPVEAPVGAAPPEEHGLETEPGGAAAAAPWRARAPWVWGAVAAALVACSGMLFVYPGVLRHGGGRPAIPLALHVEHSAGDLLLTWTRDSDAIRNAREGVLTISDGDRNESHPMNRNDLQTGSIVYSPLTADVSFHLEVTGPDNSKTAAESVRVLRTRPSPMPAETAKSGPAAANPSPAPTAAPAAGTGDAAAAEAEAAPTKLATASRRFDAAPLSQRLRPALPSDMPDAPGLSSTPGQAVASINLGAIIPIASAVPAPAPGETRAPAPAKTSQLRPAELIFRQAPEYPAIAVRTHASGEVRVQAVIGVDGKIKSAQALSGPEVLQRAATDAVRQWRYKPTVLNGVVVESQTEVVLTFDPRQ
jgi:TonB family protein